LAEPPGYGYRNPSRIKEYSQLAASAVLNISDPSLVNETLKSTADGYGEDKTREIEIRPRQYAMFFTDWKLRCLSKYGVSSLRRD